MPIDEPGDIKREQMYVIILQGDIEVRTRGYHLVEKDGYTLIADDRAKVTFMVETRAIKSMSNENMPLFS